MKEKPLYLKTEEKKLPHEISKADGKRSVLSIVRAVEIVFGIIAGLVLLVIYYTFLWIALIVQLVRKEMLEKIYNKYLSLLKT